MNEIEGLLKAYERFLQLPWDRTLAGPQKGLVCHLRASPGTAFTPSPTGI